MKKVNLEVGGTPRKNLSEGRQYGFGSTICTKTGKTTYKSLVDFTACKDFLHDVLLAEKCGVNVNVFGMKYTKQDAFKNQRFGVFAIKMLNGNNGEDWGGFKVEKDRLIANRAHLVAFLHYFEDVMKLKKKTKLYLTEEGSSYILVCDKKWISTTYGISIYTLLARIGYHYEGNLSVEDYVKYLLTAKYGVLEEQLADDVGLLRSNYTKIKYLAENGFPKEDFKTKLKILGSGSGWHNCGISSVSFEGDKSKWIK